MPCHAGEEVTKKGQDVLTFRPILSSDLPFLNRLMLEGKRHWGYPEDGLERFMEAFALTEASLAHTEVGGILEGEEGALGCYIFQTDEGELKLEQFLLDTRHLGQGFGRMMWEHCVGEVRNQGWKEFVFWSDPNAQTFYEHMGAVKIGDREMLTLPGTMAPIMKFKL